MARAGEPQSYIRILGAMTKGGCVEGGGGGGVGEAGGPNVR